MSGYTARTASKSIFVDRQDTIDKLHELAKRTSKERLPHYAFIEGDAGIGKTALIEQFVGQLVDKRDGWKTFHVAPIKDVNQPLLPFVDAVKEFFTKYQSTLKHIANVMYNFIECVPYIGQPAKIFGDAIVRTRGMSDLDKYETSQASLFSAYSQLIEITSRNKPLVIFVDDVQLLDETSLSLLTYCMHKNTETAILFVISSRTRGTNDGERQNLTVINDIRNGLERGSSRIELQRLAKSHCLEIVNKVSGTANMDQRRVEEICNAAQGNPYALRRALMYPGRDESIPNDANRVLEGIFRDIYSNGPNYKNTVRYAAVLGTTFDVDTLAGLLEVDRIEVSDMLMEMHDKYGIVAKTCDSSTFKFDHHNTHDYVCESMQPVISNYHANVAEFLERNGTDNPYVLAYHYSKTEYKEKTLCYMMLAAKSSEKFFTDSSEKLKQCLTIARELHQDEKIIMAIEIDYADSLLEVGKVEASKEILERVLSKAISPTEEARARILLSKYHRLIGTEASAVEAIENARAATKMLDGDSVGAGDAYAYLATVIDHFNANDVETETAYKKAARCYRRHNSMKKIAQLQRKSGMVMESRSAIRTMKSAMQTFEAHNIQIESARCNNNIGAEYFYIGDFESAFSFLTLSLEGFRKLGAYQVDVPLNNIGLYYMHRGEYEKAMSYFESALEHYSETFNLVFIQMNMATLHRMEGRLDQAMCILHELEDEIMKCAEPTLCDYYGFNRGATHCDRGEWDAAVDWLQKFKVNTYKKDQRLAEAKRARMHMKIHEMQGISHGISASEEAKIQAIYETRRPQKWFYEIDYYPCDIHMWD